MNYTASIRVRCDDPETFMKAFSAEEDVKSGRATWELSRDGDDVEFRITANDSVALRAMLNSITKLLTVYEKVGAIQ